MDYTLRNSPAGRSQAVPEPDHHSAASSVCAEGIDSALGTLFFTAYATLAVHSGALIQVRR